MSGGAGNDIYAVDSVNDVVIENSNEGTDTVSATSNYTLTSNVENLTLVGPNASGVGNSLDNYMISVNANNTLAGGLGNDTYQLLNATTINENVGEGTDWVYSNNSYTLAANLEHLVLNSVATALNATGNTLNNLIQGNSLNNSISGGAGNDSLDGNTGLDTLVGGTGDDLYYLQNASSVITENASEGTDTVSTLVSYTLASNVENLVLYGAGTLTGTGNSLDNYLTGNGEANTLSGSSGNDTLDGGAGTDSMAGGTGNDTFYIDSASDIVSENASEGTDTIVSGITYSISSNANVENLTLSGSSNINATGNSAANVITGNSGNNSIDGSTGNDTMAGGAGNDTYVVDSASDVINENASEGTDTINTSVTLTLGANIENLTITGASVANATGNTLDNYLTGSTAANSLSGGSGNDTLDGSSGIDTLVGGTGDDTYIVDLTTDVLTENSSEGTDTVVSGVVWTLASNFENLTLSGSTNFNGTGNTGNNVLTGNSGNNSLLGGTGNDTLIGGLGADTLKGEGGDDVYYIDSSDSYSETSGNGTDTVVANFSETLANNFENLTLLEGAGNLTATGNNVANVITGNSGHNTLDGGSGADTLAGGTGNDTYLIDSSDAPLIEIANEGIDTVQSDFSYSLLSNFENLTLTSSAISGTGNSLDNYLLAANGAHTLSGGAGNDTLDGGAGTDSMTGGTGDDTYFLSAATDIITELSNEGTDTVNAAVTYTLGANLENLNLSGSTNIDATGNTANNAISGNSGDNSINGGSGADTMSGGLGDDIYVVDSVGDLVVENSSAGADSVETALSYSLTANVENLTLTGSSSVSGTGNSLANSIVGNAGNNTIDGGAGIDTMAGGTGNDIYFVDNSSDVVTEASSSGTADAVYASASFALGNNVENLTLTGSSNISGTGNNLDNVITGNSGNNTLTGGTGSDNLIGGLGDDTYVVDASDTITENANEGIDTVQSSVSFTLAANFENLVLTGTSTAGTGNAQNNYLLGAAGGNLLTGAGGNDTLDGGAGADTMVGGTGDDVYYISHTTDVVTEATGEGIDTVNSEVDYTLGTALENLTLLGTSQIDGSGNEFSNIITGNSVANSLFGADGNDSLFGAAGNDTLNGGLGSDTLSGGLGNDTYIVESSADVVIEATSEGTDTIQSSVSFSLALAENVENLILTGGATDDLKATGNSLNNVIAGDVGNNVLLGGAGNDSISGANGNNTIDGGTGADTMTGGTGNDSYYVDNVGDVVNEASGGGSDVVYSSINYTMGTFVESLALIGETDITATGNSFGNIIIGNSGNNTLDGAGGNDTMRGGLGNDTYLIEASGVDVISEDVGGGSDTVQVGASYTLLSNFERLILTGTSGINGTGNELDNYIQGTSGANSLVGAAGNDTLDGTTGNDTMVGGLGDDVYVVDVIGDSVTETSGQGTDTVVSSITYTLGNEVENLTLSGSSNLNGTGNTLNNQIVGNTGANSLTGGAGNDTLDGGAGVDTLVGGTGDDVFTVDSTSDVITESAGQGTDTVISSVSLTLGSDVENLTLTGSSAINGTGNSLNNVITGNEAANTLSGASGNDTLIGGSGNDTLDGGTGNDSMQGSTGDDSYLVDSASDVVSESADEGIDTVSSSVSYTLGANVENLILTGASALSGTGNALDNTLTANTAGSNSLAGGLGNDTYVIKSATDVVTESLDAGTDTVQSAITYTLSSNVENLSLTGANVITGTGNSLENVITGNNAASTLAGGTGNDTYIIQNTSTVISEASSSGTDSAQSSVSYTIGANVENLQLTGISNINGTGNSEHNLIVGNTGNNSLSGANGNDTLDGGGGQDTLVGGAGDDTFIVDSTTDVVTESASSGLDTVFSSVNWTLGSDVENLVLVESDTPALNGSGNSLNNSIIGNSAANSLTGAAGNDTLDGGIGNDTLVGGTGDDTYFVDSLTDVVTENASEGTDTVSSAISWSLSANVENLTITGEGSVNAAGNSLNNVILGNDSSNIIFGDAGNDSLVGNDGFDTLDGGSGNDTMLGGDGSDTYFVDHASDVVTENADEGIDTVNSTITYTLGSNLENLTLLGSSNLNGTGNSLDNRIYGNAGNNSLTGGAGNDTLRGDTGADTMVGGTGNDVYYVDNVGDVITEIISEGTDTVYSSVDWSLAGSEIENLVLSGFTGLTGTGNNYANSILGGDGNDTLSGGSANDTLDGGLGDDSLIGGTGDDSFIVDSENDVVVENASEGTDSVSSSVSFTLGANVENLTLTGALDSAGTGNSLANVMVGNDGMNYLSGGDANDTLSGFDGNDTLHGGLGNDSMIGGTGDDTYFVNTASDTVVENADEGIDTVMSDVSLTLASNVENLTLLGASSITGTGNSLDNLITGNTAANTLTGGAGNDTLNGGLGADSLVGGTGDDTYFVDTGDSITESASEGIDTVISSVTWSLASTELENLTLSGYGATNLNGTGNGMDNTIIGDRGDNSLDGAAGNDSLSGGLGNDTLLGGSGNDTLEGGAGNDTYYVDSITDVVTEVSYLDGVDRVFSGVNFAMGAYVENLTLTGTAGLGIGNSEDNYIIGNSSDNTLIGGYGNDTLDGGSGNDVLAGGLGDDVYNFYGIDLTIVEDVGQGIDTVNCYGNLNSLSDGDVENITLVGSLASWANANGSDNYMTGNLNANSLYGGAGNDTLDGGSTGSGIDTLVGGLGDDTFILSQNSNDVITENLNEGIDTVKSAFTYSLAGTNLENLFLTGTSAINATGNGADNVLAGNSASNSLSGGAGNDTYQFGVGGGSDTVSDSAGTMDRISFDGGLDEFDIAFFMSGNNLQMGYLGGSDQVTVLNQTISGSQVDRFELSNGKYLTDAEVNTMIQAMSTYATANSIAFTSLSDVKNNSDLMNIVATTWHS
jgi:Ca2+-binding RTX toxin-like protein